MTQDRNKMTQDYDDVDVTHLKEGSRTNGKLFNGS